MYGDFPLKRCLDYGNFSLNKLISTIFDKWILLNSDEHFILKYFIFYKLLSQKDITKIFSLFYFLALQTSSLQFGIFGDHHYFVCDILMYYITIERIEVVMISWRNNTGIFVPNNIVKFGFIIYWWSCDTTNTFHLQVMLFNRYIFLDSLTSFVCFRL